MRARPHPPSRPHGRLEEPLPGLFFITGTIAMPGPVPVRFSRAMTVVKEGERLVLVNSVRLDEAGLAALDALGRVTDVVRLAGNHGSDDPFYAERYGAKVWAPSGAPYVPGFDPTAEPYFEASVAFDAGTALPIEGARLHLFRSRPTEALLLLSRHGGVAIAGDSLQNWETTVRYFSWAGSVMMKMMGFIRPANVGPGWLSQCKPPREDLLAVLELPFEHVLPTHGTPVIGRAKEKFRPALVRAAATMK